jgi:8-oxo-dGTP diphosphatase
MTDFVVGFAFDDLGRVALVRKARPAWQAGKLNGIGGHIEPGESPVDAMDREFMEETGVLLFRDWRRCGLMTHGTNQIWVFTTTNRFVRNVKSMTDETVSLFTLSGLSGRPDIIENVPALIALCRLSEHPTFGLNYRTGPSDA